MGISLSILLVAIGAILAWAVSAEMSGVDIQVVGIILLIVGIVGFVFPSSSGRAGVASVARVRAAPTLPRRR